MINIKKKYWCAEEEIIVQHDITSFTHDLTRDAELGKLEPMIGREQELERLIRVLCRRTKNNPVVVGEAGVGKTALVEGLATAIVNQEVPPKLIGARIVTVDLGGLVAGTRYRGEFEERLQMLIEHVKESPEVILFIDEIHTLIGAGAAEGTMDAANMLKPALSRGQFRIIGATTIDEYRKYIERDPALERRFQPIRVNPPTQEETVDIILRVRKRYEDHHDVVVSNEAVIQIVELADRYIPGRFFPDKALDILDEACTLASMAPKTNDFEKKVLAYYFDRLDRVRNAKEDAVRTNDYMRAAKLYDYEQALYVRVIQLREYLYDRAEARAQNPDKYPDKGDVTDYFSQEEIEEIQRREEEAKRWAEKFYKDLGFR